MNQITQFDQTMTSREIASVTGKEHRHVLRDIRVMLQDIGIEPDEGGLPKSGQTPHVAYYERIDPQNGQAYPEYRLDRDLTLIR